MSAHDADVAEILQAVAILAGDGQVVEVRALDVSLPNYRKSHTRSGYFSDAAALASAAAKITQKAVGVYVTLNPVTPDLLARCANKLEICKSDSLTTDRDVVRRRWLLVDVDPVRPSGISATESERDGSLMAALQIADYLKGCGWADPVIADSGNGTHLLYGIDLPNDQDATQLIKGALHALDARFSNDVVKIDTAVFNAGRIVRLYGTLARKGDDVEDRPHRVSRILQVPGPLCLVSRTQLEELGATAQANAGQPPATGTRTTVAAQRIPTGNRHTTLVSLAGTMIKRGMGEEEIAAALLVANQQRCEPPLDNGKVQKLVSAVVQRYGAQQVPRTDGESSVLREVEEKVASLPEEQVQPFPLEVLPEPARRLVVAGAKSLGCPPDLIAVPVLVTLGTAIGAGRCLEVKPGWREFPSIYAAIVARPGGAKSPAQSLALAPLQEVQAQYWEVFLKCLTNRNAEAGIQATAQNTANHKAPPKKRAKQSKRTKGRRARLPSP